MGTLGGGGSFTDLWKGGCPLKKTSKGDWTNVNVKFSMFDCAHHERQVQEVSHLHAWHNDTTSHATQTQCVWGFNSLLRGQKFGNCKRFCFYMRVSEKNAIIYIIISKMKNNLDESKQHTHVNYWNRHCHIVIQQKKQITGCVTAPTLCSYKPNNYASEILEGKTDEKLQQLTHRALRQ